ncbi:MAG: hypothetical protein ACRCSQ_08070 [Bacteroidales bacterium]
MITGPFKVSRAFSEGWKLTKKHWLVMIGLYLGFTIVSLLLGLFQGADVSSIRYWLFFIITLVIGAIFNAGYIKMYLVASEDEEPEFNLFGKSIKKVVPLLIASLLYGLGTMIGTCLLIIPGIWFAIRFSMVPFAIMDTEDCGIIDSFKKSYEMTKGKFWPLLGMFALFILCLIAGLICLIVGVFLAGVLVTFAQVAAYRMLDHKEEELVVIEETGSLQ